jgi:hypothetical protein
MSFQSCIPRSHMSSSSKGDRAYHCRPHPTLRSFSRPDSSWCPSHDKSLGLSRFGNISNPRPIVMIMKGIVQSQSQP